MRRLFWLLLPASALAADMASKAWVLGFLKEGESHRVIDGFFNLRLSFNNAAIFGSLSWIPEHLRFALFNVAGLVALIYFGRIFLARETRPIDRVALGLILGGALGNGLDRLFRGYVVDFLDFVFGSWHYWTFNLADSFILVGFILYLLGLLRGHGAAEAQASAKP